MPALWLTYAWADNERKDVDYVAQELRSAGVEVKLDRWELEAGKRLWEQIDNFIRNPEQSAAWAIYATQNSFGSQACREELSYALERALNARGDTFPLIAIAPSTLDRTLIPGPLVSRLYVSTSDHDWKERIKAAVERRKPAIERLPVFPFDTRIHVNPRGGYLLEIRPRAGAISRFAVGMPISEYESVNPILIYGAPGGTPDMALVGVATNESNDWRFQILESTEITPTRSCYVVCKALPSTVAFGAFPGPLVGWNTQLQWESENPGT